MLSFLKSKLTGRKAAKPEPPRKSAGSVSRSRDTGNSDSGYVPIYAMMDSGPSHKSHDSGSSYSSGDSGGSSDGGGGGGE